MSPMFCKANEERKRTFGIFFYTDFLELNVWCEDIKKNQLANINEYFYLKPRKIHIYLFLIHVLNKAQSLVLLPRNFRNQNNMLYLGCGASSLL